MRRLTRYSIRSLLVLVTLACVVFGWYGVQRNVRQRELTALEELAKLTPNDDEVFVNYEDVIFVMITGGLGEAFARIRGPQWLTSRLNGRDGGPFYRIVEITLWDALDDRAIPHLAQLTSLESIHLADSRLSEKGKARLKTLFPNATIEFHTLPQPGPAFDENPFATDSNDPFAP